MPPEHIFYYVVTGICMLLSRLAGSMLSRKFQKYSASPLPLSGADVAQKMLADSGINDVKIIHVPGQLTDHYNPLKKTVNLSEVVFQQRNVAAAAVAAHECGHAVQHAKAYGPLKLRSALVPAVNLSSKFMPWVLMGGLGSRRQRAYHSALCRSHHVCYDDLVFPRHFAG